MDREPRSLGLALIGAMLLSACVQTDSSRVITHENPDYKLEQLDKNIVRITGPFTGSSNDPGLEAISQKCRVIAAAGTETETIVTTTIDSCLSIVENR